jgi:predicted dinucleotide-binding enzyme
MIVTLGLQSVRGYDNAEAAAAADIVVLTVPPEAQCRRCKGYNLN